MEIWKPVIIEWIIFLLGFICIGWFLQHIKYTNLQKRKVHLHIVMSIFSVLFFLLSMDTIFGIFVVQSDGFGFTLASKRWFQKYWKPINSLGYRDYEHKWKDNILFVIGDSFIAGYGIKDISNRLSSVLAQKMGNNWTTAILAQNGWDTNDEFQALIHHPKTPEKIVWSYYVNDINHAAKKANLKKPNLNISLNGFIRPFIDHSFILNWLYWHRWKKDFSGELWNYMKSAYQDEKAWKYHKAELLDVLEHCKTHDIDVAFIVWPNLDDVKGSKGITSKIVKFLNEEHVKTLDLTKRFWNRKRESLVVNRLDGHPNEAILKEVANLVFPLIRP